MQVRGTAQPPANRRARPAAGTLPALQSRSQDKRDRLLQAGMQVFGEVGYEAARVADIASAAGMSVGVFYQRFKDKRALFSALEAEFVNRGAARTAHFLAAADPTWSAQTLFEQLLVSMGRVMKRNVGFFRALVSLAHVDVHVIGPVLALDQRNAELLHAHLIEHRLIAARVGPGDVLYNHVSATGAFVKFANAATAPAEPRVAELAVQKSESKLAPTRIVTALETLAPQISATR